MKLGLRILFGHFVIVGMTAWMSLNLVLDEIKPVVRKVSEETLVETANALAALIQPSMRRGEFSASAMAQALQDLRDTPVDAAIWDQRKTRLVMRVYVTDAAGRVIFDNTGNAVGADYSQWNDVYLTLRGKYGARSTREDPDDEATSVMYVAAPIRDREAIIGVLTVALPGRDIQPYIDEARATLALYGFILLGMSLLIGIGSSAWLIVSLRRLSRYALSVSDDRVTAPPRFARGTELQKLTDALETMRARLQGKAYIERYVHSLTHELKSPLSAIRATSELLHDEAMPADQRTRFLSSIESQCERLTQLVQRLLELARLEQRRSLERTESIALVDLLRAEAESLAPAMTAAGVDVRIDGPGDLHVTGERFLLTQAVGNLLDNAIGFAEPGSTITARVDAADGVKRIRIANVGPLLPEYALARIGERFYSLPRPNGDKGSGLGLSFVREVMALHGGSLHVANHDRGVEATLSFC